MKSVQQTSLPDEQVRLHIALRRNMLEAGEYIRSRFSGAGFADISADEAFLLGLLGRTDRLATSSLLPKLGISEHEAREAIGSMARREYLRPRDRRAGRNQPPVILTERGTAVVTLADVALKAFRWASFPLREGDIIVSTPMKCGTTWTQMICALLVFQDPSLPAPLSTLSPWLDSDIGNWRETLDALAAQDHRRIIKTHLPLSELPMDPDVTYLVTARNLLDAALSNHHHGTRIMERQRKSALQPHERATPHDFLIQWIATDSSIRVAEENMLPRMLRHLAEAWEKRGQLNIILLHYDDLAADLEGEMRRIAARLGISVAETAWPALVKAASFSEMRAMADQVQPEPLLSDAPQEFFHKGVSGAPQDFLAWLHRDGRPA
jgi:aryl sulfotransferase